uniref:Uncharacterized protein n=1 Tax=Arundo donax TaxID=35708 RepID=A0A0A9B123_ARUDO
MVKPRWGSPQPPQQP